MLVLASCDEGENDPCATADIDFVLPTAGDALAVRVRACVVGAKRPESAYFDVWWNLPADPARFEVSMELDPAADGCRDGTAVVLVREDAESEPVEGTISIGLGADDASACTISLEYEEPP